MKKYIAYIIAGLVLVVMFSVCTAEELEPQKNTNQGLLGGDSYIGVDPINPNIPSQPVFIKFRIFWWLLPCGSFSTSSK